MQIAMSLSRSLFAIVPVFGFSLFFTVIVAHTTIFKFFLRRFGAKNRHTIFSAEMAEKKS